MKAERGEVTRHTPPLHLTSHTISALSLPHKHTLTGRHMIHIPYRQKYALTDTHARANANIHEKKTKANLHTHNIHKTTTHTK